jgi:endonuclease/exonuclease/phosphatase family metal-dependent hydrolase
MRVLTWNLKHGRSVPSSGRNLFEEFAAALGGWQWDFALLQEVPPWWPRELAVKLGVHQRHVLTSRNSMLPLRQAVAIRWPDLIKSNGGGANTILTRKWPREHRSRRLSWLPERRWIHGVSAGEQWIANLHTQGDPGQVLRAARMAAGWAGSKSLILGGDFNLRTIELPGLEHAAGHEVDHVFVTPGLRPLETAVPDSGHLSDHAPIVVSVAPRG